MKYCLFLLMLLPVVGNGQIITTVAGTGVSGYSGDNGPATAAKLSHPSYICQDLEGNFLISDHDNNSIRKVNISGIITTIAGNGTPGYSGDGEQATEAQLRGPMGIAVDGSGNIYFCDNGNHVIRKINTVGVISTIAGTNVAGYSVDGIPATSAMISSPYGIAIDAIGNIYFPEVGNFIVRKIDTNGIISTIAGNRSMGYSGDNGPATDAEFKYLGGIAVSNAGIVYIADYANHRIRKVDTSGIVSTFARTGIIGNDGDGLQATAADLNGPNGVYVDNSTGEVYITANYADVVRKVNTAGIITTIAGNGTSGYSGDGGSATMAQLANPNDVVVNSHGNVLIAEFDNNVIRKITYQPEGLNTVYLTNTIQIYPNPAQNEVAIKSVGEIESVQVINTLGRVQVSYMPALRQKEVTLNIQSIPPGIYFVKVNETYAGKFVKE